MKLFTKIWKAVSVQKITLIVLVIPMFVLLAITWVVAYEFGERRTAELILHSDLSAEAQHPLVITTENEKLLREQLHRLTNDYESACANYQELYATYDELYTKAGAGSGQEKVVRPDNARGNQTSCYR